MMSLTNNDLRNIGNLIGNKLDKKLDEKLAPIMRDVAQTKKDITEIRKDVAQTKKDINQTKVDITHIRKDQKIIINFFDNAYLDLRGRIERIENYLKLPKLPTIN